MRKQLISDWPDKYLVSDVQRFLRLYTRVRRPAACMLEIDPSLLTVWTSRDGLGWIKTNGSDYEPSPGQSWCRSYLTALLSLSPREYDQAKKELFSNNSGLNGVYRNSQGSYALVYQKPKKFDPRAIAAAATGGALVATGFGVAKAVRDYRQKVNLGGGSLPGPSSSETSSDDNSEPEKPEQYVPCVFENNLNETQLDTDLKKCYEYNKDFIRRDWRIPVQDIEAYEEAVTIASGMESFKDVIHVYQTQINAIQGLASLGKNLFDIKKELSILPYQQLFDSDFVQPGRLNSMTTILSTIGDDLAVKARVAIDSRPVFQAIHDKNWQGITNPFNEILRILRNPDTPRQTKSYLQEAVLEILQIVQSENPDQHQELNTSYKNAIKQEAGAIPLKPQVIEVDAKTNERQQEINNQLKEIETKVGDHVDATDDLATLEKYFAKSNAPPYLLNEYRTTINLLKHLNTIKASKTDIIELLNKEQFNDIVEAPLFKKRLNGARLMPLLNMTQISKLNTAHEFDFIKEAIEDNDNTDLLLKRLQLKPNFSKEARQELANLYADKPNIAKILTNIG